MTNWMKPREFECQADFKLLYWNYELLTPLLFFKLHCPLCSCCCHPTPKAHSADFRPSSLPVLIVPSQIHHLILYKDLSELPASQLPSHALWLHNPKKMYNWVFFWVWVCIFIPLLILQGQVALTDLTQAIQHMLRYSRLVIARPRYDKVGVVHCSH